MIRLTLDVPPKSLPVLLSLIVSESFTFIVEIAQQICLAFERS